MGIKCFVCVISCKLKLPHTTILKAKVTQIFLQGHCVFLYVQTTELLWWKETGLQMMKGCIYAGVAYYA